MIFLWESVRIVRGQKTFSYFIVDLIKYLLYYKNVDTFTALAEPTRRNILEMLVKQDGISAGDIYGKFKASPPAISQHLKVLREAKLVRVEKRAQQRIYYLEAKPMRELERWIKQFAAVKETEFQRLDKLLDKLKQGTSDTPMLPFSEN
jgi:DNA-binding transcriptional ArsR family regulator